MRTGLSSHLQPPVRAVPSQRGRPELGGGGSLLPRPPPQHRGTPSFELRASQQPLRVAGMPLETRAEGRIQAAVGPGLAGQTAM